MRLRTLKLMWWLALASAVAIALLLGFSLVMVLITERRFNFEEVMLALWMGLNVWLALRAYRNLRFCLAVDPGRWTGAWQVTLSDLLSAVFVFVAAMAVCRAVYNRDNFLLAGVPISMLLGSGYFVALLFMSRMGYVGTSSKGVRAAGLVVLTVGAAVAGFFLQFFALWALVLTLSGAWRR